MKIIYIYIYIYLVHNIGRGGVERDRKITTAGRGRSEDVEYLIKFITSYSNLYTI